MTKINVDCLCGEEIPHAQLSRPCTFDELMSPDFQRWTKEIKESPDVIWRKTWEFDFIAETLNLNGMLNCGKKGLGFAVGQEPLPALFAKYGCNILATDLDFESANKKGWVDSSQHTDSIDLLNKKGICPSDIFDNNVYFKNIDMNNIPDDLIKENFDFLWSSCALEHIGTRRDGINFIINSLKCLKPGGIAVHTTEYNISSNIITLDKYLKKAGTVMYRKRDLEYLANCLKSNNCEIDLSFKLGTTTYDLFVDKPPYKMNPHLRLKIRSKRNPFSSTSYGLIIKKLL